MDPFAFIKFIIENANGLSVFAVLIIFILGVVTERIHVGPEFKRLSKRAESLDELVKAQTEELTQSRVAHAEAVVRIEFLEQEDRRKAQEIEDLRRGLESVQAELNRMRETWTPPVRPSQGG